MDQRLQFVRDALSERFKMTELCLRCGVSRRVGYEWLARFEADGRRGLVDESPPTHVSHADSLTPGGASLRVSELWSVRLHVIGRRSCSTAHRATTSRHNPRIARPRPRMPMMGWPGSRC